MTSAVKITRFGGEAPKISTALLPEGYGQHVVNAKLSSGDLVPYRNGKAIQSVPSSVSNPKTIFPMTYNSTFYWNMWVNDVDIAKSSVANITTQRIYYSGDGAPKATDINRAVAPVTATKTADYTQVAGDYETTVKWAGLAAGRTYNLLAAATAGNQFFVVVWNADPTYNVTIDPNGAETVNLDSTGAAATCIVDPGKVVVLKCNGTSWTATTKTNYPYDYFDLGVAAPVSAPTVAYKGWTSGDLGAKNAAYTTVAADSGRIIDVTATPWTLTLGDAATMGSSFVIVVRNIGNGTLTVNCATAGQLINGSASASLNSGDITIITCNGTSFSGSALSSGYTSYVYTYVTKWGEESAPSPASNILLRGFGQNMTITGLPTAPPAGNTDVRYYRIYRTNTGSTGTAYQLVTLTDVTIGTGTGTYTDTTLNSALGVVLPSALWLTPPSDLQGFVNMANGMMAAFHNNEICFCEPYKPHAWPLAYRYSVDAPIVGIASLANTLVITTTGRPALAIGNHPSSVTVYPIDLPYPCLSKRGIVPVGTGVIYPTFEGLVYVSGSTPVIATKDLFTRTEWANWYPSTFVAKFFDGRYFANFTRPDTSLGSFVFQNMSDRVPLFVDMNIVWTAAYSDMNTGFFYYVYNNVLYQWDEATMGYSTMEWWSREYTFDKPVNFGAAKLEATFVDDGGSGVLASIQSGNASLVAAMGNPQSPGYSAGDAVLGYMGDTEVGAEEIAMDGLSTYAGTVQAVQFTLYANGVQKFTKSVTNNRVFRLPVGFKSDKQSVKVSGPVRIHAILMAETPQALERISGS